MARNATALLLSRCNRYSLASVNFIRADHRTAFQGSAPIRHPLPAHGHL